jgi:hypothetical protein
MAGGVAIFVGLVVAGSIRDIETGAIFAGIAFIAITTRPDAEERRDIDDQDRSGH